ncbi:YoaK family protein [Saccharopolyspora shandongensis]|uniref:YoaK family protein n=1 Tax=Saccharopolyspora shandongensis TaxID=418495 RepID=UPI0033FACBDF
MRALLTDVARTLVPPRGDRHGPLPPLMLALTVVTGVIDAVTYLGLGKVFVANMTGNVVFLGFALGGAVELSALASVVSLVAFLAGALAGGRVGVRLVAHRGRLLAVSTGIHAVLMAGATLAAVIAAGIVTTPVRYVLIVLLGLGMGMQNAVARRLGVPDLTTTVLTLTLTGLAADSKSPGGSAPRPGRRVLSVLAMFLGALVGALFVLHGQLAVALGLALLLLLATAVTAHRLSAPDAHWAPPTT